MTEEISQFIPKNWKEILIDYVNSIKSRKNEYDKRAYFKSQIMEKVFNINPKYIEFESGRNDLYYKGIIFETKNKLNDNTRIDGLNELKNYIQERNKNINVVIKAILTDFLLFEIYDPKDILDNQPENTKPIKSFRVDVGSVEGKLDDNVIYDIYDNLYVMFLLNKKLSPNPVYLIPELNELINKSLVLISDLNPGIKFEAWKKYVSMALGNENETSLEMYKKHAILYYISVILVARALGHDDRIDIILKGDPFISDGIMNFIEPDNFFDFIPQDHNVFKFIENALNKFDFTQKIGKDIFRVLYEDLITPSERHSLGEFYTPEWLAKILVDDVITEKNKIVLDPACGSGTFLREVILKKHELGETLDEIASEVIGFDINPIAVAISKATYLLTISEIDKKFKPNIIYVFLADSLMPLKDVKILKGKEVLENAITVNFDEILPGEGYYSFYYEPIWSIKEMTEYLIEISQTHEDKIHLNDGLINRIEKLAKQNKNHIWYYILRNIYTPYYFINKIDIVLGNPPWLTFKDIKNLDRQNFLNALYKSYELSSGSEYKTQIDMVEFFIVRSQEYLRDKENGIIAFILTRAILNGGQYDSLRRGKSKFNLFIDKIWDLDENANPFRKPACIVKFSNRKTLKNITGFLIKSTINVKKFIDINQDKISLIPTNFYLNITEDYSGISSDNFQFKNIRNNYKKSFKNGASIFPRPYFFIEIMEERTKAFRIKTENIYIYTKKPNKKRKKGNYNFYFNGEYVPKELVYEAILGENIDKFRLIKTKKVVLPIVEGNFIFNQSTKNNSYKFNLISKFSNDPLYKSYEENFNKMEEDWEKGRGSKFGTDENIYKESSRVSVWGRLNYNNSLTKQFEIKRNKKDKKLVVYNTSGKTIRSAVIDNLNLIVDYTAYYSLLNENEAYYITGILNSSYLIKVLNKAGILSERHITKKPFDLPFPNFDKKNELHKKIAELSKKLHQIAIDLDQQKNTNKKTTIENIPEFKELNEAVKKLFES